MTGQNTLGEVLRLDSAARMKRSATRRESSQVLNRIFQSIDASELRMELLSGETRGLSILLESAIHVESYVARGRERVVRKWHGPELRLTLASHGWLTGTLAPYGLLPPETGGHWSLGGQRTCDYVLSLPALPVDDPKLLQKVLVFIEQLSALELYSHPEYEPPLQLAHARAAEQLHAPSLAGAACLAQAFMARVVSRGWRIDRPRVQLSVAGDRAQAIVSSEGLKWTESDGAEQPGLVMSGGTSSTIFSQPHQGA